MYELQFQNERTDKVLHDISFSGVFGYISACDKQQPAEWYNQSSYQ